MSNNNIREFIPVAEFPDPIFDDGDCDDLAPVNLLDDNDKTLLAELSRSISKTIQFPLSTVYAHALGCVAAAMNRNFYVYIMGGKNPVNIYIISSQPPSTGKSGVNKYLTESLEIAYDDLSEQNEFERAKIKVDMKAKIDEIKNQKDDKHAIASLTRELKELEKELKKYPDYEAFFTNATPEALEKHAFLQNGMFNIISDEAGALLSTLGITYGESNKLSNADMVLQGWDMDRLATIRVNREKSKGKPRGVFAVLAQDETIDSVLMQADRGVGISERFLICRERDLLGSRNHMEYSEVSEELLKEYSMLINNLVFSDEMYLGLSKDAEKFVRTKKQELEPEMAVHGKYSSNIMRGVIGKMDKQVCKLAAIIHASENYVNGVSSKSISLQVAKKAYHVYMELTKVYMQTSDDKGYSGKKSQINAIINYLQKYIEKGVYRIRVRKLLDNTKKTRPWKDQKRATTHFQAVIMPELVRRNICWYTESGVNEIKINPKIN